VSDLTDNEGWMYSTSYDNVHRTREGGRACKRSTDRIRRRKFIHREVTLLKVISHFWNCVTQCVKWISLREM